MRYKTLCCIHARQCMMPAFTKQDLRYSALTIKHHINLIPLNDGYDTSISTCFSGNDGSSSQIFVSFRKGRYEAGEHNNSDTVA